MRKNNINRADNPPEFHLARLPGFIRAFVWANIATQVMFPLALAFTPAVRAMAQEKAPSQHFLSTVPVNPTVPYTLGPGETTASVAKKFGLTVAQLKTLNQFRVFAHGFDHLTTGDELDVPVAAKNKDNEKSAVAADSTEAATTAAWASRTGSFLGNDPNSDAVKGMATGMVTGKATEEVNQWLNHFGNARVRLGVDDDFSLKDSSFDMLVPLWERQDALVFTQGSLHRTDDRTQANLGFGLRHFERDYMLGINSFLDYDLSRDHARTGMGAEYWRDFLKLSANTYLRLTNWKDSPDLDDYEERPANGWDLRAEGWLPSYPQLGAKVVYEKYYGDNVGLFGNDEDDLQKNPQAITLGVNYTPFPLLTVGFDQKQGSDGKNDSQVNLDLTFQPGVPLATQLDGDQVAFRRSLAGSRYDLVDRNNNIVLEYRKKEVISLKTASVVSGYTGETKSLGVSVNAKYGLDHIQWDDGGLSQHGGQIVHNGGSDYSVIMPALQTGTNAKNTYMVRGVAYDKKGNASESSESQVSVAQSAINNATSTFLPATFMLSNDGADTQDLELTLQDINGQPVKGVAADITLQIDEADLTTAPAARKLAATRAAAAQDSGVKVSKFTETSPGKYKVTVTAGTRREKATLTPVVQGVTLSASVGTIGNQPRVSNLTLSGTLSVGEALHSTYVFDANNGEPTDKSTYAWGEKGSTEGKVAAGESVTTSGTVPDYTIVSTDAGKVLEVSVQAKNAAATPVTGNTLTMASDATDGGNDTDGGDGGEVVDPTLAPAVANLAITGTTEVGQALAATYTFDNKGGEPTDKSTYAWGAEGTTAANVAAGNSVVTSGTVPGYTILAADAGKVLEVSVQAKNNAATPVTGNTLTAKTTSSTIDPTIAPAIADLTLTGTAEVGQDLGATYTFADNGGEPTDKSTYAWGPEGTTAANVTAGSSVTTSGTVPAHTLVSADAGKVMEVSVQAKNNASTQRIGNTLTEKTTTSVVDPTAAPEISGLAISGTAEVGQKLGATYTFDNKGGEPTDKSTYVWGTEGTTSGTVGAGQSVATSGTVPDYTVVTTDAGKVLEVSVQAKNAAPEPKTGNTLTAKTTSSAVDPDAKPAITSLAISGTVEVGQKLGATYTFNASNGEPTDKSTYVWGAEGTTAAGVGAGDSVTTSGTVPDYTIVTTDAGKVLEVSVQAKNNAATPQTGNTLTAKTTSSAIDPTAKPAISALTLTGTAEVGQKLSGTYTFAANNGEPTDKSTFVWGAEGTTAAGVAAGDSVTTSGTVPDYTLVAQDAGKVMEVSVQAKNNATVPQTGNTLTAKTTSSIIDPTAAPAIAGLAITGTANVGEKLSATYTFDDKGGEPTDKSTYAWGPEGTTSGTVGAGQSVATSGTVPDYTIVTADAGKVLEVSVQAKNNAATPVTGNIATAKTTSSAVDPTAAPAVSNLAITGTPEVDQKLGATYTFAANNGEPTDKSTFAWGAEGTTATAAASGDSVTTSGTVPDYTIESADAGKVLEVSVQAKNNATTPVTGNTDTAKATTAVVDPTAEPAVSNLAITGTAEVGQKLGATYTFAANNGEPTDKSTFAWGAEGTTAAGIASGSSVTTSGTVPDYTIAQTDAGKVLEVSVQAKNNAATPVTGNTETTKTTTSTIDPTAAPSVTDLAVSGTAEVGEKLSGTYTFAANNGEPTDKSTFAWGAESTTASKVTAGASVTTSGTVPDYTIVQADAGTVLEVSVQAKNAATTPVLGNTQTVKTTETVVDPVAKPAVSNLAITGTAEVGQKLGATYTFNANNGEPTDKSTFAWGAQGTTEAAAASGDTVDTSGVVPDYTIVTADAGKVMEVSVLATNDASTPATGNTATATTTDAVIDPTAAPSVADLAITGTAEVGQQLGATYTFAANNGEPTDKSTYAWGAEGTTSGTVGAGQSVTTSGTVPGYTIVVGDAGKILEVSVQAKNAAATPVTGNIATAKTSQEVINPAGVPVVSALTISGTEEVGQKLGATYTFDANNGEPTDKSTFAWGAEGTTATAAASGSSVTTSGVVPDYTIVQADAGTVLEVSVKAKNAEATPVTGNTVTAKTTDTVIDPTATPAVSALTISGTAEVGQKLGATYTFAANNGEPTDKSTFAWGAEGTTAAAAPAGSSVTTSGTVPDYTILAADAGTVLEVSVQAKNNASTPATGNTATAKTTDTVIDPTATPAVSALTISGTAEVGQKLGATYTFAANNGEPTDKSTYAWGAEGTTSGTVGAGQSVTTSGTVPDYTILAADAGTVLEVSVQAKNNASTPATGNTATAKTTDTVIDPTATPAVSALTITGTAEVGQQLGATYTFAANNGEPTDKSTYAWGAEGTTAAAAPAGSSVTTSGTVPGYTIAQADAGTVLEVSVQAKNNASTPATGNTGTAKTTGAVIDPVATPSVADLAITGTAEVGQQLGATYTFAANNGEPTDKSTFAWGAEGTTAAAAPAGSSVTTSGTVPGYTIVGEDTGKVLEVSVQAKNNASTPATGNTGTAKTTTSVIDPTAAPVIAGLAISGTAEVGQQLGATYTFDAKGGEPTDKSTYVWGAEGTTEAGVASGDSVTTSGTVPGYTIAQADAGKVLEVSVQAKNAAATPVTGNTLTAQTTSSAVDPAAVPSVADLAITGTAEVGQQLGATYTFAANNGEPTDKSTFAWGAEGTTAAGIASGSSVTTSGTVPGYTIAQADAGKVLEVSVQAKNAATTPVTGNTLTVQTTSSAVDPAATPSVADLAITGAAEMGQKLGATYTFDANNGEPTDKSTYVWGVEGSTAANVAAGSSVTTSGTVPDYTIVAQDIGTVLEVSVQAKNNAPTPATGNTATAKTTTAVIDPTAKPVVSSLAITGTAEVGSKLSGTYTFSANNGEPTDKSTYAWGAEGTTADAAATGSSVTSSGAVPDYTIVSTDAGKVLEASVQAKNNATTPQTGNTVTTKTTGAIVDPTIAPEISALQMSGKLEVGEKLSATYTFDAKGGEPTDKSTYAWGEKDSTVANVTASTVTTSGTVPDFTIPAEDVGKLMEVSVQAKNNASTPLTGNTLTVTSTPAEAGNNTTSGDEGKVIDPNALPSIEALSITGVGYFDDNTEANEDNSLNATYTFNANNGNPEDKSVYKWGYAGETAGDVTTSTDTVVTTGKVPAYVVKEADVGKVLEVSVMPVNGVAKQGTVATKKEANAVLPLFNITLLSSTGTPESGGGSHVISDNGYRAKNTETITANFQCAYPTGRVVANCGYKTMLIDILNRHGEDATSLVSTVKVNGTDVSLSHNFSGAEGTGDSAGKFTLAITQPNSPGVENALTIAPVSGNTTVIHNNTVDMSAIFSTITSPDTSLANMWGHMDETVTNNGVSIKRPRLASETSEGNAIGIANESWAYLNWNSAMNACSVPLSSQWGTFVSGGIDLSQHGWPTTTDTGIDIDTWTASIIPEDDTLAVAANLKYLNTLSHPKTSTFMVICQ